MKHLLINLLIIITVTGCKNTSCPSFPEIFESYFPYSEGEVINFATPQNDTLHMTISENWATQSYSIKWNCKCSCEASMGFKTNTEADHLLKIEGEILIYPDENKSVFKTEILNAQVNSDIFSIDIENKNPYLENNSNIFGDTIKIEKTNYNRISSIKIIKGKGLVEFYDKNQNCKWIKIN
jgi:hypothetical protein